MKFESFDEIFAEYLEITNKTLNFEKKIKSEINCGNGRYREEFKKMNLIAFGSYGIVCKAADKKNNEIFAIKKIPFKKQRKKLLKRLKFCQNSKVI